ncbi:MAG: ABC transporter substrate-binding protein, partial [Micromonosporaceae bacterium]|nr:ABC transporter substrate-binding protein [Micromonosporaceae bacterium]
MTQRRTLLVPALIGVFTLVGAACAPAEETGDFEPGPLGAVTIAPDAPIKIGSIQAISGDTASLGTDQVRAIEVAIADRGTLLDHDVELQSEDDQCKAEGGTTAAQKL